jgi:hypothetical protein
MRLRKQIAAIIVLLAAGVTTAAIGPAAAMPPQPIVTSAAPAHPVAKKHPAFGAAARDSLVHHTPGRSAITADR